MFALRDECVVKLSQPVPGTFSEPRESSLLEPIKALSEQCLDFTLIHVVAERVVCTLSL